MIHTDDRGSFTEFYRYEALAEVAGHPLELRQANQSVSRAGVIRGIHYALVPPGQAKYVSAPRGSFIDFVIDLRVSSPTFGRWESVRIDDAQRNSVYLSEGLGHAVVSLVDDAVLSYLVSSVFDPTRELTINPFDAEIGLELPPEARRDLVSAKDLAAPTLAEAQRDGLLPSFPEPARLGQP